MYVVYPFLLLLAIGLAASACPKCFNHPTNYTCASDGKVYRTPCTVYKLNCQNPKLNLEILYEGQCVDYSFPQPILPQPPIRYTPIDCSKWPGPSFAPCPHISDPRCGNDCENYDNECRMCRAGKLGLNSRHLGRCTDYELALTGRAYPVGQRASTQEIAPLRSRPPNCVSAFVPCPRTYGFQVCGSNGKPYASECVMCEEKRQMEKEGKPFDVIIEKFANC